MDSLLSLTGKRWTVARDVRPELRGDPGRLAELIAVARGIDVRTSVHQGAGIDATLLPDFEKAAQLIRRAVARKDAIGIVGDYDCDGITSTAILVRYFRRRGCEPQTLLPDRLRDGYGLKTRQVEELRTKGATLLLTVDTGITAVGEIAAARALGMDAIVLDHHHVPTELPAASAILHPGLAPIPPPHPCAAGIAWSVVRALEQGEGKREWEGWETDLALAAIGTVADLVELKESNRALVIAGTQAIRFLQAQAESPVAALCRQAGITGDCTARDIAFRLAPRINAAGRMADPSVALRAILGDGAALRALEELNRARQDQVAELIEAVEADTSAFDGPFLCLARGDVTPGVAGLIAGKLTEKFGRPSLVASIQGDLCTASLRSNHAYHVTEALQRCRDLLVNFGGHAQAAGCTFAHADFPALRERLCRDLLARCTADSFLPTLLIDTPLDLEHVTVRTCESLGMLEPCGQGNPEPRFLIENVILEDVRGIGRDGSHLQARVEGRKLIGFGLGKLASSLREPVDLVCKLSVDTWQGRTAPQLMVDDVRIAKKAGMPSPVGDAF